MWFFINNYSNCELIGMLQAGLHPLVSSFGIERQEMSTNKKKVAHKCTYQSDDAKIITPFQKQDKKQIPKKYHRQCLPLFHLW